MALPANPAVVTLYLAELATPLGRLCAHTMTNYLCAINRKHFEAGQPIPGHSREVHLVALGIRRCRWRAPRKARAMTVAELTAMLDAHPGPWPLHVLRNRALLTVALATGVRATSLLRVPLPSAQPITVGYRMRVPTDKTAKRGFDVSVLHSAGCAITCPACRLAEFLGELAKRGITTGPLFAVMTAHRTWSSRSLSVVSMRSLMIRMAAVAGIEGGCLSARSPRRGAATAVIAADGTLEDVQELLRHMRMETSAGYVDMPGPEASPDDDQTTPTNPASDCVDETQ
jgi:hypothetical protein